MTTKDEIRGILDDITKAVAAKDIDRVVSHYTSDAILLPPGQPAVRGTSDIGAAFRALIDAGVQSVDFETTDVVEDGALVIEVGTNVVRLQLPEGDVVEDVGKYMVAYRRQLDGRLLLAIDAFNSDSPG
jgi:ketosteroid isomerase-like protein